MKIFSFFCLLLAGSLSVQTQELLPQNESAGIIPTDAREALREWSAIHHEAHDAAAKLARDRIDLVLLSRRGTCQGCAFGYGHSTTASNLPAYITHIKQTKRALALRACHAEVGIKTGTTPTEVAVIIRSQRLHTEIVLAQAEGRLPRPPPLVCGGVIIDIPGSSKVVKLGNPISK